MSHSSEPVRVCVSGAAGPEEGEALLPSLPAAFGEGSERLAGNIRRLESLLEARDALAEESGAREALASLSRLLGEEWRCLREAGSADCACAGETGAAQDEEANLEDLRRWLRCRRAEHLRFLEESSMANPHPVLRITEGGMVLDANRAGRAFYDRLTAELGGRLGEWWRQVIAGGAGRSSHVTMELDCGGRSYLLTMAPVPGAGYVYLYVQDVSGLKTASRAAEKLAMQDPLTGLPNRTCLRLQFDRAVQECQRRRAPLSVAFLDLNGFKLVNDRLGHAAGDQSLKIIASSIGESLSQGCAVGRWGGDEFVLLYPEMQKWQAKSICERLVDVVAQRTARETGSFVTFSFGIACFPGDGKNLDSLLEVADGELLREKRKRSCERWARAI